MKVLFVYPRFNRHADDHPELLDHVPLEEYLGSPSLGIACLAAVTPDDVEIEFRDDRLEDADRDTDADLVALSFFTPAATRALELADRFRARGKPVVAGGVFPTLNPEVVAPHVDAVVVGEGEPVWRQVLADARAGALRPRYDAPLADLSEMPLPDLSVYFGVENEVFRPDDYPVQITRGCPMKCVACAIPGTMGRSMRAYPLEHVLGQIEQLAKVGKCASFSEDTSWFPAGASRRLLDALVDHLLEHGKRAEISYIGVSMPMILATPVERLKRAREAGVEMFYLVGGFDPVTRRAFTGEDPKAEDRAVRAMDRCREAGIEPYTSFLIGNDDDDEGTVDRMLEFAARVGLRKAEFAVRTPYPGTPDWHRLSAEGRILTKDWHRYNDANVVFQPARMSPERLQQAYLDLWHGFYAGREELRQLSGREARIQF